MKKASCSSVLIRRGLSHKDQRDARSLPHAERFVSWQLPVHEHLTQRTLLCLYESVIPVVPCRNRSVDRLKNQRVLSPSAQKSYSMQFFRVSMQRQGKNRLKATFHSGLSFIFFVWNHDSRNCLDIIFYPSYNKNRCSWGARQCFDFPHIS